MTSDLSKYMNPTYLEQGYINHFFSDKYLYHYTKTSNAIEYILLNGKLKFGKLKHMNDPLEFQEYNTSFYGPSYNFPTKEIMNNFVETINKIVKNDFKVCCFCSDTYENFTKYRNKYPNTDFDTKDIIINRGYSRPRMWAQYAEIHSGVCIIFNKERLLNQLQNLLNEQILECLFYDKILYSNILPKAYNPFGINPNETNLENPFDYVKDNITEFFFKKLEDYRDENEYRIILLPRENSENDFFLDIGNCIEGLVLGAKFSSTDFSYPVLKGKPILRINWWNGIPYVDESALKS